MATSDQPNPSPSQSQQQQPDGLPPPPQTQPQSSQPLSQAPTAIAASPPLPQRHTPATPGPRAQRFQEMYDLALQHTLSKISHDNFAACYPTIARDAPHILRQVQRQMVDRLAELCNREFAAVLASRGVVGRLNELEGLVGEAERRRSEAAAASDNDDTSDEDGGDERGANGRRRKKKKGEEKEAATKKKTTKTVVPPHLLGADDIMRAHLAPHLAGQQSQMNAKLQNAQASNVVLFEQIQAQRTEMEGLLGALEKILADVDGANELMDGVVEDVAKESLKIEHEMADA